MEFGQSLPVFIARNRHGQYCVPAESLHRACALSILKGRVWEQATLALIQLSMRPGGIVCAGTYFGDMLPPFARMAHPHPVWAFEPNPVNFACASITRLLNTLDNVRLFQAGLGAEAGRAKMKLVDKTGLALGGGSRIAEDGESPIEILTIDAVVGENDISVIQLDVEGQEIPCLLGAERTVRRCLPILAVEHVVRSLVDDPQTKALLDELGYVELGRADQNTVYAVPAKA